MQQNPPSSCEWQPHSHTDMLRVITLAVRHEWPLSLTPGAHQSSLPRFEQSPALAKIFYFPGLCVCVRNKKSVSDWGSGRLYCLSTVRGRERKCQTLKKNGREFTTRIKFELQTSLSAVELCLLTQWLSVFFFFEGLLMAGGMD